MPGACGHRRPSSDKTNLNVSRGVQNSPPPLIEMSTVVLAPSEEEKRTKDLSPSVEDVFLRYLKLPDVSRGKLVEKQEVLRQGLKHVKCEAQMLEAMTKMQALEEEVAVLNDQQQAEAQDKIGSYNPEPGEIRSVREAEVHVKFLNDAITSESNSGISRLQIGQLSILPILS
ncbi:uncharacterized protein LOC130137322 [Syzygium oleosum]|uniref:uncharacterized protein LOC130137322 n=1 Tax=Syzygium oleosum TaxID=219896 RepID=UPI0024B99E2A|nr:uncharacterized protein LOC130137322 [Syzygium oleosum]